ncbi:nuclear valosin-containing protein-like [Neocloeon triangulifer]|uniref:nuclear valosin-containing protein-like n=1 Tax=Neocloeon triangulifer TaxID=2078957 RepID=UPI00286F48AD|nr:nuclear valosin-containing protein-like [Neocloeon triangulifer]
MAGNDSPKASGSVDAGEADTSGAVTIEEIIEPEDGANSQDNTCEAASSQGPNTASKPNRYFLDSRLLPRVYEFIKQLRQKPGDHHIQVNDVINYLIRNYKEYERKKKEPFRACVTSALKVILEEEANQESDSDIEEDDGSPEAIIALANKTSSNSLLNQMYMKRNQARNATMEQELIDITSSDDDSPPKTAPASTTISIKPRVSIIKENSAAPASKPSAPVQQKASAPTSSLKKRKTPQEENANRVATPAKRRKFANEAKASSVTFNDIGGIEHCLKDVCQLLVHIKHPEVYDRLGVSPPRGFLLHGPPGCGKSLLANAIAGELNIPLMKVAATELVAGLSGESEERIREVFENAKASAPCVLFLDEIDAIAPHRANAQREMERRIVAQLLVSLDDLSESEGQVIVVGATNRPDSLDPALRRAGRFDREVCLGIPNEKARVSILDVICAKLRLSTDLDLAELGKLTPGFVGADLTSLAREAAMAAVNRVLSTLKVQAESIASTSKAVETPVENGIDHTSVPVEKNLHQLSLEDLMEWLKDKPPISQEELEKLHIERQDFMVALKKVQPSAKREGFATVPDVTWNDIGSLKDIREELKMTVLAPVQFSEEFSNLGLSTPAGVLLCGPPGCGKTLLAKAVANEAGINFISVKGPELLNMYVGESERAVRQCFQRAKNSAPCVIFFDELDSLCPKRSESGEGSATMRVVNQMLTEMDGIEGRLGVFLMAATNRPDIVDPAVLRPGRLDKILYVGLPGPEDRTDILRALTKNGTSPRFANDVSLEELGDDNHTIGYTGADLAALVREASLQLLKEVMANKSSTKSLLVELRHFNAAISRIRPSVSDLDKLKYERLKEQYGPKN